MWTQAEAIAMATTFEKIAPKFGAHVALTGGLLYKKGPRKDADIVFYRVRQQRRIDEKGLMAALGDAGLYVDSDHGWMSKASWKGKRVDLLFPEPRGSWWARLVAMFKITPAGGY